MVKDDSAEKTAAEPIASDDGLVLVSWHDWIRLIRVASLRELQQKKKSQNSGTSSSRDRET
jgi:hypothetical protein